MSYQENNQESMESSGESKTDTKLVVCWKCKRFLPYGITICPDCGGDEFAAIMMDFIEAR